MSEYNQALTQRNALLKALSERGGNSDQLQVWDETLVKLGAQIILCDPHRATVIGLGRRYPLRGITMSSPDIRAGQALLIAALSAEGRSVIQNIEQIDRGYQYIDERLKALGADIRRI